MTHPMYRLPLAQRVIGPILAERARADGARPYLTYEGATFTFREADRIARSVARGMTDLGVKRGDRIALLLPNGPEFVWAWYATALLGAPMVPINSTYTGSLLEYVLRDSDARGVVVHRDLVGALASIATDVRHRLEWIAVVGGINGVVLPDGQNRWLDFAALAATAGPDPEVPCDHTDIQSIMYTSGTTGPSKGVIMPNGHFFASAMVFLRALALTTDDVLFTPLPLFHGLASRLGALPCLMMGAHIVIAPKFSASQFWEQVCKANATVAHTIFSLPPMLKAQPPSPLERRHRLRAMYNSNYDAEFEARFNVRVVEAYGLTETGLTIYTEWPDRRPGSCGRIDDDWEANVVDDTGLSVPTGETGELVCRPKRASIMMEGYLNKPAETLASIRNLWFHTGDYAHRDEAGYFYFSGRKKERIRRRGENISSWEIERVVNAHPLVAESAAVAHPSPVGEDDVRLVVVLSQGATMDPLQFIAWIAERLPPLMVPRYLEFVTEMPRTPSNKVEKYKLIADGLTPGAWDREAAGYKLKDERERNK
ncbi:MAG: AMP-binding protein [Burkholderiales bacterium]